ncbi:TetR family transcriptional regulator [Paenarthrobacter aurescens]|uniref:TetR family transcriptional regulator n=1 Tax=Paenarthrobacter aurescens TaxID=43663 RepID=UPI0021C207DB|nr:TetR family transcriptional regulator [Paenarthrobacter aurescens]MCT9870415.1 TetR family transcriptional regulator [Paenarthrobacter aurescens]
MSPTSERRKYAIAATAIKLFIDRGYDAVTAEEIAAEAGIAARTFFRYFPTKEQAAFPDHEERVQRFKGALAAHALSTDPIEAAIDVSLASAHEYFEQPELYRPRYRLVHTEPALRDHERIADRAYELALEEFLVGQLGHPDSSGQESQSETELAARIFAAGLVAAVDSVLDTWAFQENVDLPALLDRARVLVRRSAHALFATAQHGSSTGEEDPSQGLVLVISEDHELKQQITALVTRHRSQEK